MAVVGDGGGMSQCIGNSTQIAAGVIIVSGGVGCGIVLNFGRSFLGLMVFLIFLEGDVGGIWLYNGYGY